MGIVVTFEVQAKEGSALKLKQLIVDVLPDTRARPACRGVIAYNDQDNPNAVFLIEHWDSRADYEDYLNWRVEIGTVDQLGALIAAPPTIRYFDAFDG